jgi:hypothetical protein
MFGGFSPDGGPPGGPPAAAPKADGGSLLYMLWLFENWVVFGVVASKIGKLELTSLFMNWSFVLFCMKSLAFRYFPDFFPFLVTCQTELCWL